MAQPPQSDSEIPTAESPSSEPKDVLRLVCGWNEKTNTYLYRDEVVNPPPIYGNGPQKAKKAERVSKRPKTATAKVKLSRGEDVKMSSADAKPRNVSARGREKMERLRRDRADRRGKRASPHQQPSPVSTPASESGHRPRRKRPPSQSVNSESNDTDDDSSDEVPPDKRLYAVPDHLQGTVRPVPRPENSDEMPWIDMEITTVPLPEDPAVKIAGFDNIMVTLVSPENGNPHNEPAKVLDCRLHPDGTYFLLVSWWFERRALSKNLVGFKRYLDRRWPADAPFKFVLGCHFDVITNDAITEKMEDDERFCNSMVYGGVTHNCELFSDVPDEMERRECLKKGAKGDARHVEERKQKSLFRMLLHPEMSGK
ncbi:hypothetical protein VC83_02258 [Pseudogymnoascus destructans]|uniref:Uncharacterized protein n=2 Tax=Pseudogymnoascus destructans TaxID=655981 RepID=L8G727_PSED2|nr:uncharacterized protein VC83_02258 [Pseudogymnoascus destructans]ELR08629.1 hypothetical protein GMDG_03320 [Pseudogymnoascus destructans 20631-21]OAF61592.1 hypothetical protein VC83_02258 [Pseudogymnoascus destructans]